MATDGVATSASVLMSDASPPHRVRIRDLLRKSAPFVAPYRAGLWAIFAMALTGAAFGACEPLLLGRVFDELGGGRSLHRLTTLAMALAALLVCKELLVMVLDRKVWSVRIAIHEGVTRATVERLHTLPLSY